VKFYKKFGIFRVFYDFWQNIFLKIKIFQKNICLLKFPQVNLSSALPMKQLGIKMKSEKREKKIFCKKNFFFSLKAPSFCGGRGFFREKN
jgi:hypothetical protein